MFFVLWHISIKFNPTTFFIEISFVMVCGFSNEVTHKCLIKRLANPKFEYFIEKFPMKINLAKNLLTCNYMCC